MRAIRWLGLGCGGSLVLVVAVAIAVGVKAHNDQSTTAATTAAVSSQLTSQQHALAYIATHGGDAYGVQANLRNVELAVGALQRSPTQANINQLAEAAQTAHDNIDNIRADFTYSGSGSLGEAEGNILLGANDLKNAMGALVAYAGSPNAATLAHFNSQYGNAKTEWNSGVRAVWRTARHSKPPVV